jgi:hypothetical protein
MLPRFWFTEEMNIKQEQMLQCLGLINWMKFKTFKIKKP